ncbi:beta-glucosidase family protein [Microbacterium sp. 22242]|uniref:beta-glucosidase n=1 Tax=Microbacterium sp. 22242 TaxID=3453896 RepID=UPI003F84FF92
MNPNAEDEELIEQAMSALSLPEKVRLLSGADSFSLHGEPEIGLEPVVLSDGPTGVRGPVVVGGRESCLLPNASLLAQTWSAGALAEAAAILADEAEAQQTHVVLGPTINLHRSPLGGRLFEAFSEDPLLTGHLAAAYTNALQRRGIAASVKHFIGNESETERTSVNVSMTEKTLREVYLAPFEIAIQDADPWTLMAAYNDINGVPSTEQHALLTDVLKTEWGYDGVIVSDWYATTSSAGSAVAGLDLVMPGPVTPWSEQLVDDVRSGAVPETVVDDHLRRLLRLARRVGALGETRSWATDIPSPAGALRREQLTSLAARGMVVLKNQDGLLPLPAEESVALIGRHAVDTIAQGGGSAQVRPPHVVSVAEGIRRRTANVVVVDGVETRKTLPAARPSLVRDPETGSRGVRARVLDAAGRVLHSRHLDVAELEDSQTGWLEGAERIEFSALLDVPLGGPVQLGTRGPGNWRIVTDGFEDEYRIDYHPGPGGGFFRPASHASTVMVQPGQQVTASVGREAIPRILGLVVGEAARSSASAIAEAAAEATGKTAIVVVGLTTDQETEGQDKTTLALPGDQDALVAAVAASADRTVVVVNAASPVLMPWIDQVDAVLFAGLPGQEAGDAIAAALFGEVAPEGRLVTTFPRRNRQGPAWTTAPRAGMLTYDEGVFLGYRGWDQRAEEPAFWFGHGLGYTTWEYVSPEIVPAPDHLLAGVRLTVRNTGQHSGTETVQAYFRPRRAEEPIRLIGWAQVTLEPGMSASVTVPCDRRLLRRWDEQESGWRPVGTGSLILARGLGDVRVTIPVEVARDENGAGR